MTTQSPEKHEFQAEVKQVLDIVVHSLYTDKEIFLRELISNASDATEKLKHLQLSETPVFDENLDLKIEISADEKAGTITILDFGIGMNHDELVENLGTIAHSGSKAFLKALAEGGEKNNNLIGQFGVGFYSAFMVADQVEVLSRSYRPDEGGWKWVSDGSGSYEIQPEDGLRRGTRIVLTLKEDQKEFAAKDRIQSIIKRYSSFVPVPIELEGEKVNTVQAVWLKNKSEVKDEEYKEFYKFQAHAFDEPRFWLHFNADAPIAINSLLFCPQENPEKWGFGKTEPGVALHCRKVLIDSSPKNLLPDWLRFLRGVVDSPDIPLNISRESMQDSALITKLRGLLTKRFIKHLENLAKRKPDDYEAFWKQFQQFIKEGVSTDFENRESLAALLRFESSMTKPGKLTSFKEYLERAKEEQKEIYFLYGHNRKAIESGPYLEAFQARGIEVIYVTEPVDEFVMSHAGTFAEKTIVSADNKDIELPEIEDPSKGRPLAKEKLNSLIEWMKEHLGERVSEVSSSERLVESPAIVLNADRMMTAQMRRIMESMGEGAMDPATAVAFQVNPKHKLVRSLYELTQSDADRAALVCDTLFDNCLMAAGLLEDPKDMISRVYSLLDQVTAGSKGG